MKFQIILFAMTMIFSVKSHALNVVTDPAILTVSASSGFVLGTATAVSDVYFSDEIKGTRNVEAEKCLTPNITITYYGNNDSFVFTSWGQEYTMKYKNHIYNGLLTNACPYEINGYIVFYKGAYTNQTLPVTVPPASTCEIDIPSTISFDTIPADEIDTNSHEVSMHSSGQCDKRFSLTFTGESDGEYFKLGDYLGLRLSYGGVVVKPGVAIFPPVEQNYIWSLYPLKAQVPAGTYTTPVTVQLDVF